MKDINPLRCLASILQDSFRRRKQGCIGEEGVSLVQLNIWQDMDDKPVETKEADNSATNPNRELFKRFEVH